jgi:hypothetical protein
MAMFAATAIRDDEMRWGPHALVGAAPEHGAGESSGSAITDSLTSNSLFPDPHFPVPANIFPCSRRQFSLFFDNRELAGNALIYKAENGINARRSGQKI